MHFGKACRSPEWRDVWRSVNGAFFGGISFHRKDGEVQPVPIKLHPDKPAVDGDTVKIVQFLLGDRWIDYTVNVRTDGVDTPESNWSEKLKRHVECVTWYLRDTYGVDPVDEGALKELVNSRIVYLGKLAGVVSLGFCRNFADTGLRLAPAYTFLAKKKNLCDTLDIWDKYGRILGRIMAGGPNQGEDLIAGFIEAVVPGVMPQAEAGCRADYMREVGHHAALLARWKAENPELYNIIGPESAPVPTAMFDQGTSTSIARIWRDFIGRNPSAVNDMQTMMAFLGLAFAYPKYLGHRTAVDLAAELTSLGVVPSISTGHGFASDQIYRFLRPSANPQDPLHSPVYLTHGLYMSGIKDLAELDPKGCHEIFGCGVG